VSAARDAEEEAMDMSVLLLEQLLCQECCRRWLDPRERWRAYVTDDEPAEPVLYCPTCAAREFDPD
jgi:hypothetical protein